MCTYYKENGKMPHCTHDCDGCMFHEDSRFEEQETTYSSMSNTEEALKLVQECLDDWPCGVQRFYRITRRLEKAIELLKEQPQIVRCKNCTYALFKEGVQHGHIVCTKPFTERWQSIKPNNWYCADGKQRTS